jgi:Na+-driven multidrug efflux pump
VLAPVLIFGWGTGHALGVAGAGLASFIAVLLGLLAISLYVLRSPGSYLRFSLASCKPDLAEWWHMLKIGLPAGAELALLSVYILVVYVVSRPFGAPAQAGFGIGLRVLQAAMLPAVALGIAVSPVAGQNFAAGLSARVRESFRGGAAISMVVMGPLTLLCYLARTSLVLPFSHEPPVVDVGYEYLAISAWMLIPTGLNFVCSSMFQALGYTLPSLLTAALRYAALIGGILAISSRRSFELRTIWYLALATVSVQFLLNLLLLRREFARRLPHETETATTFDAVPTATANKT